jgi:4-hydroxy-tetrahydrodipicolinate synthase
MSATARFQGIIPPMLTAFNADGSIDWEANKVLIDYLIKNGVHGIFVNGSAGEFSRLNIQERLQFAEFAAKHINGRVPLLIGTGSCNTFEAIHLTRHARDIGADGALIITPYYWRLSEDNLLNYFARIADAVDIPILIYSFPALTGQQMPCELVGRLANDYANIVGIKASVDSIAYIRQLIAKVKASKPEFSVLVGWDDHLFYNLAMGGDGAIPGTANFCPEITIGIYENFIKGNLTESLKWHRILLLLLQLYELDSPPIRVLKEACRQLGVGIQTFERQSIGSLDEEKQMQVSRILQKVKEAKTIIGN